MPRLSASAVKGVAFAGLAVSGLFFGTRFRRDYEASQAKLTENFELGYTRPTGWKELSHGPQALFVYRDPKTGVRYRGSVNQVVAEFNPTPNLTSDGLAEQMVSTTKSNMPGWKGVVLDSIQTPDVAWRLVRRSGGDRCVITAFGVRGNTTAMISMIADGREMRHMEAKMPHFRQYVQSVTFSKADLAARMPK